MYDSHCHLDFPELALGLDEHLRRARAVGVEAWHVPGCGPSQWPQLSAVSGVDGVTIGVGIHPWWADEVLGDVPGRLKEGAQSDEGESDDAEGCGAEGESAAVEEAMQRLAGELRARRAVALGECGLDRPRARAGGPSQSRQKLVFEAQLALARELRLPIVLHVVGDHGAALELIERAGDLPRGGVVHGYSGSAELVDRYVARGLFIGLGTRLTGAGARRAREALQRVPLDRLVLETDAPDQAPAVGGRFDKERRGVPADLGVVVEEVARQLGLGAAEVAERTTRNARRLFEG